MKSLICFAIAFISAFIGLSQTRYDFAKYRKFPSDSASLNRYTQLCNLKEFDKAIVFADSMRAIYKRSDLWDDFHFFTNSIAQNFAWQRKYPKAIEILKESIPLLRLHVDTLSVEYIYTCSSLGNFYHYANQSDKSDSLSLYLYNLQKKRAVVDSMAVDVLVNISGGLASLSHFTDAYDALITAKKEAEQKEWIFYLKNIPVFMGYTALVEGKNDAALVFYEESLVLNPLKNYSDSINYLYGIEGACQFYFEGGLYNDCIDWGKRALCINEELRVSRKLPLYSKFKTNFNSIIYKSYIKSGYKQQGDSIFNHLQQVEIEKKNYSKLIQLYLEYAELELDAEQNQTAKSFYTKAKQVIDTSNFTNQKYKADVYIGLSESSYSISNFQEAALYAQMGLNVFADETNELDILRTPKPNFSQNSNENFKLFLNKLLALYQLHEQSPNDDLRRSIIDHFTVFDQAIWTLLAENNDEKFIAERQSQYKVALDGLVDFFAHNQQDSFMNSHLPYLYREVIDGKAMRLRQRMYENRVLKSYSANETLFIKYRDVKNQIESIRSQRKLAQKFKNTAKVDSLTCKLSKYYADALYIESMLKADVKQYEEVAIKTSQSVADIQQKLNTNEAILEYYSTNRSLFSICITNDTIATSILPIEGFKGLIAGRVKSIKLGENSNDNGDVFKLLLSQYYNSLLAKNHLIIIPDEELGQFPFESISLPDGTLLLKKYSISYSYSSSIWLNGRKEKNFTGHAPRSIFAIAPSFENPKLLNADLASHLRSVSDDDISQANGFASLPFTERELAEIKRIVKKRQNFQFFDLAKGDATKKRFMSNVRGKDIVHLATHGVVDRVNPLISGIVLDSKGKEYGENDMLFFYELYNLGIDADLVVLSACNTGTGKLISGEGVMALPRGFIYAGVPNVIASLWKVHDEKTKDLMVAFYKHLLEDEVSYAEALRRAKLDCINKGFLPLDWAGFVLIGN